MSESKNRSIKIRKEFLTINELDKEAALEVKWLNGRMQRTTFPFAPEFLKTMGEKICDANPDRVEVSIRTSTSAEVYLNGSWVVISEGYVNKK